MTDCSVCQKKKGRIARPFVVYVSGLKGGVRSLFFSALHIPLNALGRVLNGYSQRE